MDILELLKQKEEEFKRVQKELEALKLVVKMMQDQKNKAAGVNEVASVAGAPIAVLSRTESQKAEVHKQKDPQQSRHMEPASGQFP
jgi:hypothetical protein